MGFEGVRPARTEADQKAEDERQAYIRAKDPFPYDAGLAAAEGTSATSTSGDFTKQLPKLIVDNPQAVRPDYGAVKGDVQYYGGDAAAGKAESTAHAAELAQTMQAIDSKARELDPGRIGTAEFAHAGPASMVIEQANRAKFDKMMMTSKQRAQQEHEAKYGLSRSNTGFDSGPGRGFQGIARSW